MGGTKKDIFIIGCLTEAGTKLYYLTIIYLMQKFLIDESVMAIVQEVLQEFWCLPFQVTRSRILTKVPRVPPLVTVAEVAPPELLASSSGFIQRILKPNILLSTVWRDENSIRPALEARLQIYVKRVPIACARVRVIFCRYLQYLQYSLQGTNISPTSPHLWVDDVPFPVWWDRFPRFLEGY